MIQTKKKVTNDEFSRALANSDNNNIIQSVLVRYNKLIPPDELHACGLEGLWRTLMYHQDNRGNKFTTSLWKFTDWECKRQLKKNKKKNSHYVVSLSNDKIDIAEEQENPTAQDMRECIAKLRPAYRSLIQEYYYNQKTMEEIGVEYGYSKESARQKINQALKDLRKLYSNSV